MWHLALFNICIAYSIFIIINYLHIILYLNWIKINKEQKKKNQKCLSLEPVTQN